jgi:arginyl-tRNA synthetase
MTRTNPRHQLAATINEAVTAQFKLELSVQPQVTYAQTGFGDFATNVAFQLAKELGKAPKAIAEELATAISHPDIKQAEAAGNGYVNLTMTEEYWIRQLAAIDEGFIKTDQGKGQKLQVEFISANPTGPLTLANARGGFLGDVLANVMTTVGYEVTREYYINDGGGQVAKLVDSLRAEVGLPIEGERQYAGEYIADLAQKIDPRQYDDAGRLSRDAVAELLKEIKEAADSLGISFDEWTSERELVESGATDRVMEALRAKDLVYSKDDAEWLASSKYGDERDRVLVKADGNYTYLVNDLAYHLAIFGQRGYARAIKLWGADHAGQVASLKLTIQQLEPKAELDFVLLQFVRLIQDGKELKMSKRAGTYVTIEELLDALEQGVGKAYAASVARWFFLMRSSDNRIDFDLGLASEQSQQNPYFYVTYAYARAHSILAKAKERDLEPATSTETLNDTELGLVRLMARLPELVGEVAGDFEAHRLIFFGLEVAKAFQGYYEGTRIIDLEAREASQKLYLVQQFIVFMDLYWSLLGIKPVTRLTQD